ncbi:uncharacterized protein LOC116851962 isoform X2 [Odontomachus brunneus]|uniref:uncharacterized protein LOC116851962 isoform X2 n=1 Tax=Odontomachus brunneus TaxID=486640 RepID=UPI0013F21D32|nr:uncharacterized protein LOC116851962 isoform X2 [Odontomachus brunneus]
MADSFGIRIRQEMDIEGIVDLFFDYPSDDDDNANQFPEREFHPKIVRYFENVVFTYSLTAIAMQAEKKDADAEKNELVNDVTTTSIVNEVTNLKIEDNHSAGSTPSSPGSTQSGSFLTSFKAFSKFGDPKSDGKLITLSQSDKWMKQAKVIDGKKITTTDTGIYFKKHKSMKLNLEQYKTFLEELAKSKKVELAEIKKKMANCGPPGVTGGVSGNRLGRNSFLKNP